MKGIPQVRDLMASDVATIEPSTSAVSPEGFEAAIREALDRANKTLRNIQDAWG